MLRAGKLAFTSLKAYSRIDAIGIAMLRGVFLVFLYYLNELEFYFLP